jgi:LmeA-like phospholipid-binding
MTAGTLRSRRRADPRIAAFALVVLLFVAGLLAVSDYLARVGSQSLIARVIQRDLQLQNRPRVNLHGAFYLPQVINGVYDHLEISMGPLQTGSLRVASMHADLNNVHLPFHDVLVRHTRRILIERTTELVVLRYGDIDRYLASIGSPVSLGPAGHRQVRFTGTVDVLGEHVSASADARVRAYGNVLYISPSRVDSGVSAVDATTAALLDQRFTVQIPLDQLPFAQTVTGLQVEDGAIIVRAVGKNVTITASPADGT